jgi:4-hydroxyacetophenone monooxygenase
VPIACDQSTPTDAERLRAAVAAANLPTLLMVLHQLTGERRWLTDPFRPTRTKGMSDHDLGGFDSDVQHRIREAAVEAVLAWNAGTPAAVPAPTGDLLLEMMSTCVGEPVPAEYEPMMAREMGFARAAARRPQGGGAAADFSVVVIGAGVSGLTAARALREAGISHVVLEKNQQVGGTWLENRYPGCGVDTPSYLYSFSFFPRKWSTHFGKRDEVVGYVQEMARQFDLLGSIRFGTEVVAASYDEGSRRWTVAARDEHGREHTYVANAVITAVGQLNRPKMPNLPGQESFRGPLFHSACWPDGLDLRGKRVAVIGTGASAMQIVPAIAEQVAHLTVVQRSPQWAAPNANYFRPVGDDVHWLMENVPYYHKWYRFRLAWTFTDKVHPSLQIDPEWPHPDRAVNAVNDGHREFFTRYLREQLEGREDLQAKALPQYPPFGKRMLIDNGWFAALRRPNVHLVTDGVAEVTETGFRTSAGEEHEADVIVFATGFEAQRLLHPLDLRGRSGRSIRETWGEDDARAHLGITTPGFPNLFFLYGPNTNLGHGGSYIWIAECQVRYVIDLICTMIEQRIGAVECRPEVNEAYNRRVDEAHDAMIWSHPGMDTWYRNPQGRVVTNAPWRVVDYSRMTEAADLSDFIVEPMDAGDVTADPAGVRVFRSAAEVIAAKGDLLGRSDWVVVDEDRIRLFADATGDHHWLHLDHARAAEGPFGTTIAHGFLTLALIAEFAPQVVRFEGSDMGVNYGLNRVRFPAPVPAGGRIRAAVELVDATEIDGGVQVVMRYTVELQGSDKPVCVAEHVNRRYFGA